MIYLNNAATTYPKPEGVTRSVVAALTEPPPSAGRSGHGGADLVAEGRRAVAELCGCTPQEVFFTGGATHSLNAAIFGLKVPARAHVVTTATEHNSVLRPLNRLERDGRIRLSVVACDEHGLVDPTDVERAAVPGTVAVVLNHCSNVTGAIQDVDAVATICARRGSLLLLDCAQSAGAVDLAVSARGAHVLAVTGHKGLYGIAGAGALVVRHGTELAPFMHGGTGSMSQEPLQPDALPYRYEAGTPNYPGIAGLTAGIRFVLKRGLDEVVSHKGRLCSRLRDSLAGVPGVRLVGPPDSPGGVVSLTIDGTDSAEAAYILDASFGIVVRGGLHCAPRIHRHLGTQASGTLRVSPSAFTTECGIDACADAIIQLARMES